MARPNGGVTGADFEKAASEIRTGTWRYSQQSPTWVGWAVVKALGFDRTKPGDKAKAAHLVKVWIGTGALVVVDGHDERRIKRQFVQVAEEDAE